MVFKGNLELYGNSGPCVLRPNPESTEGHGWTA